MLLKRVCDTDQKNSQIVHYFLSHSNRDLILSVAPLRRGWLRKRALRGRCVVYISISTVFPRLSLFLLTMRSMALIQSAK